MNSIKKLQNTIIKSPIGKPIDNNHKQWSSVIVRIRFRTGISGIERPYEYLISNRLNPTGIYKIKDTGIVQEDQEKRVKHLPNAQKENFNKNVDGKPS